MATLWTGSLTTKAQDYNVDAYVFDAEVIENSVDTTNNKSNITVNMYAKGIAGYSYNLAGPTAFINIDGARKVTSDVTYINSTRRLISSWTGNITHNDDGTKSIRVTFNYSPNSGASYLPQSSKLTADPVALTNIPRYATISSFTVAQRDETSLTFSFVANATCDYVWYSTNNGTTWTGLDITDGTSASFNVTGLSANTSYNCKVRVRRKDSQLNTDSSTVAKSTYDYPKVIAVGTSALKIGNQQTLTIYNPLGRNVTIKMNKSTASGTQLYSGTLSTSGSNISYKFTPNATTLYNSIPNDASSSCVYSVVYGSVTKSTTGTYTYEIKGNEYPTFADTNWSYSANLTSLTNNNQVAIDNQSTITINIGTQATSSYGANIDKYAIKWGTGETKYIQAGNTSTTVTGNGNSLIVTVYDKRGLPKETIKTITNIPYIPVSINNDINTERANGVEAGVKLNLSGTFYNAKFGTNGVQNSIYSAKYYVSTNGTTWSSAYPSGDAMKNAITVNGNNFTLTNFDIHANGSSGGFTIGTRYYVKVEIKDASGLLSTATATTTVTDGKIARDVYQDSNGDYHTGINGLADSSYTEKVYGNINATNGFVGDLTGNATSATSATSATNATTWNNLTDNRSTLNTTDTWVPVYASDKMQHTLRAIWTSKTHTNHGTNKEYLATLSTLTYWNGAYNSSNSSNLTYAHQGTIQCKPTSLYDNSTGSTGNVTLSQTAADFTFLQIFYYLKSSGNQNYGNTCVFSPNNKRVGLIMTQNNNSSLVIGSCIKTISGTSITNVYNGTYNSFGNSAATNELYIYKVLGWK